MQSILRVAGITITVLLLPFIAMQFRDDVYWTMSDFVIAAVVLFSTGMILELIIRMTRDKDRRLLLVLFVLAIFMYVWAELAVGIFTNLGS